MKVQPSELLKFYADTPSGQTNKKFVFKVKNYDHAVDLAARFVQEYNFKIRAAYYQNKKSVSLRIDKLHDLEKHKNSLIERYDLNKKLNIANLPEI